MNSKFAIFFIVALLASRNLLAEALPDVTTPADTGNNQKAISVSETSTSSSSKEDYSVAAQQRGEYLYPSNYGHPGIFRVRSAESLPVGSLTFGIGGEFYSTAEGPSFPGITVGSNANTLREHMFIGFSPVEKFTIGLSRINSSTTFGTPTQLISSLGDINLALSYSVPVTESLILAPLADLLVASDFNSLTPAGNTISAGIGAAATFSFFPTLGVPLSMHANLLYHMPQIRGANGSAPLPETFFRFSRFHTVSWILGAEIKLGDFVPFLEIKESVQAGSGLSFGEQPSTASIGTRINPFDNKSLSILLGADVGLGRGLRAGVPYSPAWQVLGQLSYTVGLSQTERKHYVTTSDVNVVDRKFIIQRSINFKVGSTEIDPSSYSLLDQIATVIKKNGIKKLLIVGHTDSSHTEDYNLKLSLDRAQSVKRYLVKQDISEDTLMAQGYGKRKPKATNNTEEGRALNRRVEFYIID